MSERERVRDAFWRDWYEQMKEADEHKFQAHGGEEFMWFPEYTFEQFCKSPMARFGWRAASALVRGTVKE
jgi:hypothetical protein